MRLAASEIPPLPATAIDGRVHSVFRRVINVRLGDGALLTLYAGDEDSAPPGAITITVPDGFDFSRHVEHGTGVSCRAGVLRIAGSDLSVDLRSAQRRRPSASERPIGDIDSNYLPAWRTARRCLATAGGDAGLVVALNGKRPAGALDAALAGRARQVVPRLLGAARASDVDGAIAATARLVGAGPGLTPSGDDFLAGFLVGARHAAQEPLQIGFVDDLGRQLSKHYADSGDVPRAYLAHAAAGRAAQPLLTLARMITEGADDSDIYAATVTALHIGHSSGADATFGLLCGLAAWHDEIAASVATALAP